MAGGGVIVTVEASSGRLLLRLYWFCFGRLSWFQSSEGLTVPRSGGQERQVPGTIMDEGGNQSYALPVYVTASLTFQNKSSSESLAGQSLPEDISVHHAVASGFVLGSSPCRVFSVGTVLTGGAKLTSAFLIFF